MKFLPSIAEVLSILREQQEIWSTRFDGLWYARMILDDFENHTQRLRQKINEKRRTSEAVPLLPAGTSSAVET